MLYFAMVIAIVIASCELNSTERNPGVQSNAESELRQRDTANFTTISWLDSLVNFGTITKGEKVKITFKFKNTGDKPLFLSQVRPSCGCTVADYSKGAVLPGEQGKVTGEFDSNRGSIGHIRKSIMVISNTKNHPNYSLLFEGDVKENNKKS
jgi:hypothetical protein